MIEIEKDNLKVKKRLKEETERNKLKQMTEEERAEYDFNLMEESLNERKSNPLMSMHHKRKTKVSF